MKVLGIIAEYNPFHNGHLYHVTESKKQAEADVVVAVMSGHFTQRGEIAILDKWERARLAVCCGVDLIFELPFVYACNNAEYFAQGAVEILNGLDCVDTISFGSESGSIETLSEAARLIAYETESFKACLRDELARGVSYPKARASAVRIVSENAYAEILSRPNNILAVEYIKQLMLTGSKIKPMTIKRMGADDNATQLSGTFSSAASIRMAMAAEIEKSNIALALPEASCKTLFTINNDINQIMNSYYLLLTSCIVTSLEEELESIFSAGEGLGSKMKKVIRSAQNVEDLILAIKSKRYTRTRIQRLLAHSALHLTKADFEKIRKKNINYARVLAFNETGAKLLRQIKKSKVSIPVITNINKQRDEAGLAQELLRYDILASDFYNLVSGKPLYENSDYIRMPYHEFHQNT